MLQAIDFDVTVDHRLVFFLKKVGSREENCLRIFHSFWMEIGWGSREFFSIFFATNGLF